MLDNERSCIFRHGQRIYTIKFQNREGEEISATLPQGRWDYGSLVSSIIGQKYTNDEIQAIQMNMQCILANCTEHFTEEKILEYKEEYKQLNEYRIFAKEIAKYFSEKYDYLGEVNNV